jgi:predicted amidohydrolase
LHAFPDFFLELYDTLSPDVFRANVDRWIDDARFASVSLDVQREVQAGSTTVDRQRLRLSHDDSDGMRFAMLRGLDAAFAHVNPASAGDRPPDGLRALGLDVAARHRLDSGLHGRGGALLPRVVHPDVPAQLPDHPREAFRHVLRVPPGAWNTCEYLSLPEEALLHRHELQGGLRIACVPFIQDPDELDFRTITAGTRRFYRIAPRHAKRTFERIEAVVAALDRSGARIGVVPELTLTPRILERWQAVLRSGTRARGRLQMLLVGTGDLGGERRPTNTAVLLNARTGAVLSTQHKLYPFNFGATELERWKLVDRLGDEPVDEDLHPGERLRIVNAGVVRLAILVCEDVGRAADLAAHIRDFGVSHALVPVFARPTKDRRWERAAADVHARATGSTVVVSNSGVMHSILGSSSDSGTSLVVWPGAGDALVGRCTEPDELACFELRPDGSARAV